MPPRPPTPPLFPYTTLFRSVRGAGGTPAARARDAGVGHFVGVERCIPVGLTLHAQQTVRRLLDRKSTRLNSSHRCISYAVFCLKKKNKTNTTAHDGNHTDTT